jgi:GT2 family glycosyltransferase
MSTPLVSIVIATYNRRDVLVSCVQRYADQTGINLEIIVADNGSTDGTVEALRSLPDVKLVEMGANMGPLALNAAIERAKGEYIWRTDDDAYPADPSTIRMALDVLESRPDIVGVTGEIIELRLGNELTGYHPHYRPEEVGPEGVQICAFNGCVSLLRTEAIRRAGGFWDTFYQEEVDLAARMIINGAKFLYVPSIVVYHIGQFSETATREDRTRRWVLQTTMSVRLQFRYFPLWRAVGRSLLHLSSQIIIGVLLRVRVTTIIRTIRDTYRRAVQTYRTERIATTWAQQRIIASERSMIQELVHAWRIRLRNRWRRR